MKTTTESITLSPGLDETKLSSVCLSTLIDTWSELQTSTVEAVQAPTPDLFSFAENCFFFAVILRNQPLDEEEPFSDVNDQLVKNEEEDFERAIKRSIHDVRAKSQGAASSCAAAPAAHRNEFTSTGAKGAHFSKPFEEIEREMESYEQKPVSHNLTTRPYNTDDGFSDTSNLSFQSLDHSLSDDSSTTGLLSGPNFPHDQAHAGVSYGAREHFPLSSLSRQFEPPTSTFLANDGARNSWCSAPHEHIDITTRQKKAIGIVYLTCSPLENVPAGEANIGIILVPEARGQGLARQATELVLSWTFEEIGFHRIQAGILDSHNKDRAISMFTQLGFVHEGVRRRSVYCPNEGLRGAWKDVTYLALLETEWFMRSYLKPAPKNLWDEMFARHAREREELLRWDERQQRMKRTSSMETVRVPEASSEFAGSSDEETDGSDVALGSSADTPSLVHKGKRRKLATDVLDHLSHASTPPPSDSEQSNTSWDMEGWESDEASGPIRFSPFARISRTAENADYLSDSSNSSRVHLSSMSARRSGSPSSSGWDMLEISSVSSSSFESLVDSDEE